MRTFLHVDLDAFFCAIEEQRDPSLRGKAFAVGGKPDQRGVVASCSYAARRHGVRSAMPMVRALAICPRLIVIPTSHSDYKAASSQVMELLRQVTPQVEQLSIDEAFLDITALIPSIPTLQDSSFWARRVQQSIERELGLSCSIGVASNKMMAKIATDYGKAHTAQSNHNDNVAGQTNSPQTNSPQTNSPQTNSPRAICVVPHGEEAAFLAPLPVSALWGVGPKTEAALMELGLSTVGAVAAHPPEDLMRRFGQHGHELSQHARGIDKRPLVTHRAVKSISSETTFVRDVQEWDELQETLEELVKDVAGRLHRSGLLGSTIKLKLRWSDFTTPTRQMTLLAPTDEAAVIGEMADKLFWQLWTPGTPVRLLGVGITGLNPKQQLNLWDEVDDRIEPSTPAEAPLPALPANPGLAVIPAKPPEVESEKQQKIQEAIETLQKQFGKSLVQRGARR